MLNRFFLLGSLLFSVVLPLLTFRVYEPRPVMLSEITVTPYNFMLEAVTVYGQDLSVTVEQVVLSATFLIWLYLAGVAFFIGRLLFRICQVVSVIRNNQVQKFEKLNLVYLDKRCSPFSFLNYVFVSRTLENSEGYDRMMLHEMEHVRQGHTVDVLILELLTVFQWFNPFMWMLRRAIRENHEFLADRAVLRSGVNRGFYKKLLLSQFADGQLVLTNKFNYSLIKNRIKMMSKIRSSKLANVKILLGLLTAIALIVVFACEQKELDEIQSVKNADELIVTHMENKLKITGNADDIKRIKEMMAGSREFSVDTDGAGNLFLVRKAGSISKLFEVTGSTMRVGDVIPRVLDSEEQVFFIVEKMPQFPGGEDALRMYITRSVDYPEFARENGIEGRVYVTFVVDKNGQVANARIARGVDPSLDQEALRVVNNLPNWKPGVQRGEPVNVSFTVPINFTLQN